MRQALSTLAVGVLMGVSLSRIGFSSWDEVHAMFTFQSWRLLLAFCGAVALLALFWPPLIRYARRGVRFRSRHIHRGSVVGGVLFGVGWAVSGACPSIALVQLGEGQLAAGWTLLGVWVGNWLYGAVHMRYLRWDTGSCIDE